MKIYEQRRWRHQGFISFILKIERTRNKEEGKKWENKNFDYDNIKHGRRDVVAIHWKK